MGCVCNELMCLSFCLSSRKTFLSGVWMNIGRGPPSLASPCTSTQTVAVQHVHCSISWSCCVRGSGASSRRVLGGRVVVVE